MNVSQSLITHLQASADGFIWAVQQMPVEHLYEAPPRHPDGWPAVRLVFHTAYYERNIVLPCMRQWLHMQHSHDNELVARYADYMNLVADEEAAWPQAPALDMMLAELLEMRKEQVHILSQVDAAALEETRDVVWGQVTLRWIVTKTYQHTAQHTHDVLRMALFWGGGPAQLRI